MFGFSTNKIPQVSADEVHNSVDSRDITILDVRTPGEYAGGKIKNSINLPVDQIAQKVERTIPDKDKKIYVYCLSGNRSTSATQTMINLGYKNVFNMESGLLAWRIKHYPLV